MVKLSKKLKAQRLYEKSADVYISTRHNISEALNLKASELLSSVKDWGSTKAVRLLRDSVIFRCDCICVDSISTDRKIIGYGVAYQKARG